MNRRIYSGIFVAIVCVAFGLLTGCSSSKNNTPSSIAATSGSGQSATIGTAFAAPLVVTVTNSGGQPVTGATVTFAAPSSGASCTPSATTGTTAADGTASITCTANSTSGSYSVTATVGAVAPASFALTNNASVANYVFSVSGQVGVSGVYYAIAGAVTVDSNGNVLGGEEDYSDPIDGFTSPGEPGTPDVIAAGGTVVIDPTTGIGTATITSNNTSTGVAGVQTFAVQFVNPNHALITQFDGSATSSGSLDLQTAGADGNYAFAITGFDTSSGSWGFGGVFALASGAITGTLDENDATAGAISTANAFTATAAAADSFQRSVITGITDPLTSTAVTFAAYAVGPEAMRIIDVDFTDTGLGSALGQGSATFDDTALSAGVFAEIGQWSQVYGTAGEFNTDGAGNILTGSFADVNELDNALQIIGQDQSGGVYDLVGSGINGYGSMTLTNNVLGVYMVDPALNVNDPNNTTTDVGGALILDLDTGLPGGMGTIVLQTDTVATDFNGNYAAGFQNYNDFGTCFDCELDMVGPFTVDSSTETLSTASIGADDSDIFGSVEGGTGTPTSTTGDTYTSILIVPATGAFDFNAANTPANPLAATIDATAVNFDGDIFQASATTAYWINVDSTSMFVGSIQAQSSTLAKAHAAKRPGLKATRRATKSLKMPVSLEKWNR
jgi:hypothetical protein